MWHSVSPFEVPRSRRLPAFGVAATNAARVSIHGMDRQRDQFISESAWPPFRLASSRYDQSRETGYDLSYCAQAPNKVGRLLERVSIRYDHDAPGIGFGDAIRKKEVRLTCFHFPVR